MSLHFTPSHKSAPGRYLVHGLSVAHGERYLGVVWRRYQHCWHNDRHGLKRSYHTRKAAARAML